MHCEYHLWLLILVDNKVQVQYCEITLLLYIASVVLLLRGVQNKM